MTASMARSAARAPWHLWAVGAVTLLWNALGAFDYTMTEMRVEWYLSQFSAEQLDFVVEMPSWTVAAWALGTWASVLGSVLLLLRRRMAVWFFIASLIGLVATALYTYILSNGAQIMGGVGGIAFTAVIFIVAVALLLYALKLAQRGILR